MLSLRADSIISGKRVITWMFIYPHPSAKPTPVSSPDSVVAKRLPLASSNPEGEAFTSLPPLGQNTPVEYFEARFDALSASVLGKVAAHRADG